MTTPLTDAQLAELERLADAATPGKRYAVDSRKAKGCHDGLQRNEWKDGEFVHYPTYSVSAKKGVDGWCTDGGYSGYGLCEDDASFIAAANPAVIKELVREVRRAKELRTVLSDLYDEYFFHDCPENGLTRLARKVLNADR